MSARYRWYKVHFPDGFDTLEQRLALNPFSTTSADGFLRLENINSELRFRFFSRSTLLVTKIDEQGNTSFEEVSTIKFTDFALLIRERGCFLRLENPGLNLRELLNAIESHTGLGFTCRPITFEMVGFCHIFSNIEVKNLVELKIAGAVVEKDVVARMEFVSKQGVETENIGILNGIKYTTESAVFEMICEGVKGRVSYNANGMVKISGKLKPLIVHLIEQDLDNFSNK
jgi:hypothetical protein